MFDMEQRSNNAVVMDAQTMLKQQECVFDMRQRRRSKNDAAVKAARTKPSREECVSGMEQSSNDAVAMDVLIDLYVAECAKGTGHIANLMITLRHLLYRASQHLMIRPQLFPINVQPQLRDSR